LTGGPRFVGILGHPVGHSISPQFQQAAFFAAGVDAIYQRWDTPPEDLGAALLRVRREDCLGANVTIPHKTAVMEYLDEFDDASAIAGAVNTLVNADGRLKGYNTDGAGLVAALRERAGYDPLGGRYLLLGAGGAARGIAFALAREGADGVLVANRTADHALDLTEDLQRAYPSCEVRAVAWGRRSEAVAEVNCLIHSTTIGMRGGPTEGLLATELVSAPEGLLVVDIVYNPLQTPLLREAGQRGLQTLDGVAMLVHQGALAFELWTGLRADVDVMFRAAYDALQAEAAS
jgi:shikimate dehydrogenase